MMAEPNAICVLETNGGIERSTVKNYVRKRKNTTEQTKAGSKNIKDNIVNK